jgi:hypothetical protein
MATDPDVTRAARHMIEQHETRAAWVADERARHLRVGGANPAADLWTRIGRAIRQLQQDRAPRRYDDGRSDR